MSSGIEQSRWLELPFVCPHCGNHGEPDGPWEENCWTPFKLVEEAVTAWAFDAVYDGKGLTLIADPGESSDCETRIQCMKCFELFPLPDGATIRFE